MEKDKLKQELENLLAVCDKRDEFDHITDAYNSQELTELLAYACVSRQRLICPEYSQPISLVANHLLSARQHRINAEFSWTDENKSRFVHVNDMLMDSFARGWEKAVRIAVDLDDKIASGKDFVNDYEIKVEIGPYPSIGIADEDFDEELVLRLAEERYYLLGETMSHSDSDSKTAELPIFLDKSRNWNTEYFNGALDDCYIGYIIHRLLDIGWSFKDIISIERIWTDVKVNYKNCVDLDVATQAEQNTVPCL
jgi:hypothetical protein